MRCSKNSSEHPFLGGSTKTTSKWVFFLTSSTIYFPASSQTNSALSILFNKALFLASSIACGTTSTP